MSLFSILPYRKRIPIIYQLGWWPHQDMLEITSFEVQVVKSHLNLLNSISLISYTVKGYLHKGGAGEPYIKFAHHSEQLLGIQSEFSEETDTAISAHAHIQITPIVHVRNERDTIAESISFEFTNEYKLKSLRWGNNCFQFSCGGINKIIHLTQCK